jgi:biotin carboxyl carrier protein
MKLKITVEGKTYEVDVEVVEQDEATFPTVRSPLPAPARPSGGAAPPQSQPLSPLLGSDGGKTAKAPIAGTVNQVKVRTGDQVKENDLLVVLEAMKMESNVYSQVAGKVKQVNVSPGYRVVQGQVLVEFE